MSWFEKIMPSRIKTEREGRTRSVPEGLWIKCEACDAVLYRPELERNLHVCPKCSHHMRINARDLGCHVGAQTHGAPGKLVNQLEHAQIHIMVSHRHERIDVLQHRRHHQLVAVETEVVEQRAAQLFYFARFGRQDVGNIFR